MGNFGIMYPIFREIIWFLWILLCIMFDIKERIFFSSEGTLLYIIKMEWYLINWWPQPFLLLDSAAKDPPKQITKYLLDFIGYLSSVLKIHVLVRNQMQ